MKNSVARPVWLELARRHRQRLLDGQMPALRDAVQSEVECDLALVNAHVALQAAQSAQLRTLQAPSLAPETLTMHCAYAVRMQAALASATTDAESARAAIDTLRSTAARDLSERDTFQRRLDDLARCARVEEGRRKSRDIDEGWLLRSAPSEDFIELISTEGVSDAD